MVNPLIPGEFWGFEIGLYLFLGGLAGGSYVAGTAADFLSTRTDRRREAYRATARWGMAVGLVAIAVGSVLLLSHLGEPQHVAMIWLFTNFSSWMTVGTWTIIAFSGLAAVQLFWLGFGRDRGFDLAFGPLDGVTGLIDRLADMTRPPSRVRRGITLVGAFFSLAVIVYTAMLLNAVSGVVPLWDATWLPPLFLASGLSIGLAATLAITAVTRGVDDTGVTAFSIADDLIILVEMVALYGLLQAIATGNRTAVETHRYILTEGWLLFWGGVVAVGLLIPLGISVGLLLVERRYEFHDHDRLHRLATAGYALKFSLVVVGGLMLRLLIVLGAVNVPMF